jgi:hypothetical protein
MTEAYLRGKSKPSLFFDEDQPLLVLLRDMFIEAEATYNVKELAPALGVSVFTVYKILAAQVRLPASTLIEIMEFVAAKDSTDTRLLDFLCEPFGYTPLPQAAGINTKAVRAVLMTAQAWVSKEK